MIYLFILTIFEVIVITACSSDEPSSYSSDLRDTYEEASENYFAINNQLLTQIDHAKGRSNNDGNDCNDLIGYLLSLSEEEIDALYADIESLNDQEAYELILDEQLNMLAVADASDVQKLYQVIPEYTSRGGHSVELIEDLCTEIKSREIKEIAIETAAAYDQFTTVETASFLSQYGYAHKCRIQFAADCGGAFIGLVGTALELASENYPFAIVNCIGSIADIIDGLRRYHTCLKTSPRY